MEVMTGINKTANTLAHIIMSAFILLTSIMATPSNAAEDITWYEKDGDEQVFIHLYFFWSSKCPHCLEALPDINELDKEFAWLKLHSYELLSSKDNVRRYVDMAKVFGHDASSVPAIMFCGNLLSGYDKKETTGRLLRSYLLSCYQFARESSPDNSLVFNLGAESMSRISLPLIGEVSAEEYSLPVLTVLIAGMDAFNPCAFFVLLFLLSMMVHGRSRARMALIGGIFVFFSGAIYFLFMAAWLNLFIYLGELRVITLIAGLLAVVIASINIKDYFWFKRGVSLSISDGNKPALFDRIRQLLRLDSLVTVVIATVVLAIVANSYELLCTAGFPMVYTRILTLNALPEQSYYFYLLLYNFVYILPLLAIVGLFSIKLGSRKLSEKEGMVLKLLSGLMMLMLGLLLLVAPQMLNNIITAASLLLAAILSTWLIVRLRPPLN